MTVLEGLKYVAWVASGRRPFTTGYGAYKARVVDRVLAEGGFDAEHLPPGYGVRLDERIVEYPWLLSRLPAGPGRLLDAGSALNFDFLLDRRPLRDKEIVILTLSPERVWERMRPGVSYVYGDLRDTGFRDGWFEWVVTISTLEHVGLDNTRFYTADPRRREMSPSAWLEAVAELRRVLRPGGTFFATMPFGRRHDHGWLQVFDAAMVDALLEAFRPVAVVERHFRYERDGWHASSRAASREATYFDYHAVGRHEDDYAAAARAVVCLELVR